MLSARAGTAPAGSGPRAAAERTRLVEGRRLHRLGHVDGEHAAVEFGACARGAARVRTGTHGAASPRQPQAPPYGSYCPSRPSHPRHPRIRRSQTPGSSLWAPGQNELRSERRGRAHSGAPGERAVHKAGICARVAWSCGTCTSRSSPKGMKAACRISLVTPSSRPPARRREAMSAARQAVYTVKPVPT